MPILWNAVRCKTTKKQSRMQNYNRRKDQPNHEPFNVYYCDMHIGIFLRQKNAITPDANTLVAKSYNLCSTSCQLITSQIILTGVKSTSFCCHSSRYSSIGAPLPAGADHEIWAMWGDLQMTVGNDGASGTFGRVDMSTASDHAPSYSHQTSSSSQNSSESPK